MKLFLQIVMFQFSDKNSDGIDDKIVWENLYEDLNWSTITLLSFCKTDSLLYILYFAEL